MAVYTTSGETVYESDAAKKDHSSTRSRFGRLWVAAAVAVGISATMPITSALADDPIIDPAVGATVAASDAFARTTTAGLGAADTGGTWSLTGKTSSYLYSAGGYASVHDVPAATSVGAFLPSTSSGNTEVKMTFSLPSPTTSAAGFMLGVDSRRQLDGSTYRGKVSFSSATGRPIVTISKLTGTTETTLGSVGLLWTQAANTDMTLELETFAGASTQVAARMWRAGDVVPAWQITAVDATAPMLTGQVGLWGYRNSTATLGAASIKSYQAWTLPDSAPPPILPKPTIGPDAPPLPLTTATVAPNPGSVAVGAAQYPVPANAVFVAPTGSDAAAGTQQAPWATLGYAVKQAPIGATIVLRAGTYHEMVQVFKTGQTIQAYPGEAVWFDGSVPVTGWTPTVTASGTTWVHTGWTKQFDHSASFTQGVNDPSFIDTNPMAAYPDQVFLDGSQLFQVSATSTVGPGQFSVNYATQTITIGSDPTGHAMRASDLETSITLAGDTETLQGVGVRRYGTSVWMGGTVRDWSPNGVVRNVYVSDSGSDCVTADKPNTVLSHVTATRCGLEGIHANQADGLVVDSALLTYNNYHRFNHAPAAAGIKVSRTLGVTITNTDAENQYDATGIWLDESVRQFKITNNRAVNNRNPVHVELSDTGIIANNVLDGGEYGIWVHNTGNVQIYNNIIRNINGRAVALYQDARRQATYAVGRDPRMPVPDPTCPWITQNITLDNNTFDTITGYQLYAMDTESNVPADNMNIHFEGNLFSYKLLSTDASMIWWGAGDNVSKTIYETFTDFNNAKHVTWQNMQTTKGALNGTLVGASLPVSDANTVPLPADVAAAIGQPAGAQNLGTF